MRIIIALIVMVNLGPGAAIAQNAQNQLPRPLNLSTHIGFADYYDGPGAGFLDRNQLVSHSTIDNTPATDPTSLLRKTYLNRAKDMVQGQIHQWFPENGDVFWTSAVAVATVGYATVNLMTGEDAELSIGLTDNAKLNLEFDADYNLRAQFNLDILPDRDGRLGFTYDHDESGNNDTFKVNFRMRLN